MHCKIVAIQNCLLCCILYVSSIQTEAMCYLLVAVRTVCRSLDEYIENLHKLFLFQTQKFR